MKLTDDEKALLNGSEGLARRKAMELLVRYGEALGAERLIDTNNVCVSFTGLAIKRINNDLNAGNIKQAISQFYLDSDEPVEMPAVKVFTCRLIREMDPEYWEVQGIGPEAREINLLTEKFCAQIGMQLMHTCAPYLVGNVPVIGEHCAWIESITAI